MDSPAKDRLYAFDNEDVIVQEAESGNCNRGAKRASSVRSKVTDKLKKKQTNDIPDNYRDSGSILG